jgi:hypothetical protein
MTTKTIHYWVLIHGADSDFANQVALSGTEFSHEGAMAAALKGVDDCCSPPFVRTFQQDHSDSYSVYCSWEQDEVHDAEEDYVDARNDCPEPNFFIHLI